MNTQKEIEIIGHQCVAGCRGTKIGDVFEGLIQNLKKRGCSPEVNFPFLMSQAYTYGVMQGKRQERARRKNK